MKPVKQNETQIIIVVPVSDRTPEVKKPKINPAILKAISFIVITIISWLTPEATIAIFLIKLLFMLLEWLNQNKA
ncbi:MAG: hypothetical protein AAF298_13355 [Cyanobacteria bacterium P01_A01_bin.40]